ncbi:hypothetical protein [Planococcus sp. SE5179]|uniref:hypothetical protein n=1 Tax=Planococcus sp. SE5179 TaxID=3450369 RepID=UPI003F377763
MTRRAGRWSLDNKKSRSTRLARQALEALPVMALFAISGKAEATRGAGCWSLDNQEKPKQPSACTQNEKP